MVFAIVQTFATYCTADFLSNFLQHPLQKMDYGSLNRFIGREVGEEFWGTRTQHIIGVAACLAATDHASQAIYQNMFKKELCFAKSPAAFVAHTFLFIFTGVTIYVAGDAALNPNHKDEDRLATFKSETYNSYVGSNTAWFEPYVPIAVARFAGPAAGASWAGSALLPATLAYSTVKGVGWYDWGNSGLNDLEMKINGLQK